MKGTGFPSEMLMFYMMRVIKEVHSIGPVILKFVSHCFCGGDSNLVDHGVRITGVSDPRGGGGE